MIVSPAYLRNKADYSEDLGYRDHANLLREAAKTIEAITNIQTSPTAPSPCLGEREAVARLEARIAELIREVFVPGMLKCAKCGFVLISANFNAQDGTVTARETTENCPNDGAPMWRVTEREAGNELADRAEEQMRRAIAAEAERDAAIARAEEAERRLRDPVAVHVNMLAGTIAKPSIEQILHLYPDLATKLAQAEGEIATMRATAIEWRRARLAACAAPIGTPAVWTELGSAETALSEAIRALTTTEHPHGD